MDEGTYSELMQYPGVRGVSIGSKEVGGELTAQLAIQVLVTTKRPLEQLAPEEVIPSEIDGIRTDVVEEGEQYLLQACEQVDDTSKSRPLQGGVQLQPLRSIMPGGIGTLGCLVRDTMTNGVVMLSNAHVLGDEESHTGDTVGQPIMCSIASACLSDPVGKVLRFKKSAHVDGAIASIDEGIGHDPNVAQIKDIGTVAGSRYLTDSEIRDNAVNGSPVRVQKRGRTTGHTFGVIVGWQQHPVEIKLPRSGRVYNVMQDTLRIKVRSPSECFAAGGDSGSVVLDNDRKVVGLLFSATAKGDYARASPIQFVENELAISILTATTSRPVKIDQLPMSSPSFGPNGSEVLDTPAGRLASALFEQHAREVRDLVTTNKRVGAVWRRQGGPEIAQVIFRSLSGREEQLPPDMDGQPLEQRVRRICDCISKYATPELRRDLKRYGPVVGSWSGLTLSDIAHREPISEVGYS